MKCSNCYDAVAKMLDEKIKVIEAMTKTAEEANSRAVADHKEITALREAIKSMNTNQDTTLTNQDEMYYIQRVPSGYLGNSPVWRAVGGKGYTSYIQNAEKFTLEAALNLAKDSRKYAMFKCSEIDSRLHLVFDMQDFNKLGTDSPCDFTGGKYATKASEKRIQKLVEDNRIFVRQNVSLAKENFELTASNNQLRDALERMVESYQYEASSENESLLNAFKVLELTK